MNINDLKVEKISIISLFICGLILFVEYVFGISNIVYVIYDKPIINNFNRDLFLFLYTISIIPIVGFNSKCIFKRNKNKDENKELDYIFCLTNSIFTFIFGFYLYKLFVYFHFPVSINIFTVILFQFIFFLTLGNFIERKLNTIIKKIIDGLN
jgi:hypothetical protein